MFVFSPTTYTILSVFDEDANCNRNLNEMMSDKNVVKNLLQEWRKRV